MPCSDEKRKKTVNALLEATKTSARPMCHRCVSSGGKACHRLGFRTGGTHNVPQRGLWRGWGVPTF